MSSKVSKVIEFLNSKLKDVDKEIERLENNIRVANLKLTSLLNVKKEIENAISFIEQKVSSKE